MVKWTSQVLEVDLHMQLLLNLMMQSKFLIPVKKYGKLKNRMILQLHHTSHQMRKLQWNI
jgi:hypothetical protein